MLWNAKCDIEIEIAINIPTLPLLGTVPSLWTLPSLETLLPLGALPSYGGIVVIGDVVNSWEITNFGVFAIKKHCRNRVCGEHYETASKDERHFDKNKTYFCIKLHMILI